MSNLIKTESNFKELKLNDSISLYLSENKAEALNVQYWGIDDEAASKFNSATLPKLYSRLSKEKDQEAQIEILEKIRAYQRKGLYFNGFTSANLTDESTGEITQVQAVKLYDPYLGGNIVMKQTIAVSIFQNINAQAGQYLLESGEIKSIDFNENYIQGWQFDVTFEGKKKNSTNSKSSHQFKIQPRSIDE